MIYKNVQQIATKEKVVAYIVQHWASRIRVPATSVAADALIFSLILFLDFGQLLDPIGIAEFNYGLRAGIRLPI